jgi:Acetyltransferase (GNAT) family
VRRRNKRFGPLAPVNVRQKPVGGRLWAWLVAVDRFGSSAAVAGTLVGTIVFKPADRTGGCPWLNRPDIASLSQFAVAPEQQAVGPGGRLLDLMETQAAETGSEEIALHRPSPRHTWSHGTVGVTTA